MELIAYLFPTFGYGTFMVLTYAFTRLSVSRPARGATLTRDLARAAKAHVWLCDEEQAGDSETVRVAAAVPAQPEAPLGSARAGGAGAARRAPPRSTSRTSSASWALPTAPKRSAWPSSRA